MKFSKFSLSDVAAFFFGALAAFKKYLDQNEIDVSPLETESDIVLQQLELINEAFIGKSIRDSELREKTRGLIVGLERGGKRILNPESKLILEKKLKGYQLGQKSNLMGYSGLLGLKNLKNKSIVQMHDYALLDTKTIILMELMDRTLDVALKSFLV